MKTTRNFFMTVALLLIFIMAARTALDTDLWWHLRSGEVTVNSGTPLTTDVFSITRYGENWVNHSWLAQVLFYFCFTWGGYAGIGLLVAMSAVGSMGILWLRMRGKPVADTFLLVFGGFVASVNWVPRPQVLSLVFLAAVVYILCIFRERTTRMIWFFPILFLVWGNFHGGYPLGLILIGSTAAGIALEKIITGRSQKTWKQIAELLAAGILGYLLTAVNPNGIETWFIPFQTVSVKGLQNLISEWASPDFHEPLQMLFLLYFFFLVWCMVLSKTKIEAADLLTFSIFGVMAFVARRNFGPFVIVSLPLASRALNASLEQFKIEESLFQRFLPKKRDNAPIKPALQRGLNIIIIGLLLLTGIVKLWAVNREDFVSDAIAQTYPAEAANWVSDNITPQPLLNEYNWGGFLIWHLHEFPVFIDGRTDLYRDATINEWLEIVQCGKNWEGLLAERDIRAMLIQPDRQVIQCAIGRDWSVAYRDSVSVVLIKAEDE